MNNYYAPCFYRIDFVVIPSYIELTWSRLSFFLKIGLTSASFKSARNHPLSNDKLMIFIIRERCISSVSLSMSTGISLTGVTLEPSILQITCRTFSAKHFFCIGQYKNEEVHKGNRRNEKKYMHIRPSWSFFAIREESTFKYVLSQYRSSKELLNCSKKVSWFFEKQQ